MSEDLDALLPKITRFILLLGSDQDGEVLNAAHALTRTLATQGLDLHALAERLENGGDLTEAEMEQLFVEGEAKGYERGYEQGRKSVVLAGTQSIGVFSDSTSVGPGINGHSWHQIAQHLAAHKDRFSGRDYDFVADMPAKIDRYGKPTTAQARWLGDLFVRKFGGTI